MHTVELEALLLEPSSTSIYRVCEQQRLWQDCPHKPWLLTYAISTQSPPACLFHFNLQAQ